LKKYGKVKFIFVFSQDSLNTDGFFKDFENFMNGLGGEKFIE
jgi:hypothetical protein